MTVVKKKKLYNHICTYKIYVFSYLNSPLRSTCPLTLYQHFAMIFSKIPRFFSGKQSSQLFCILMPFTMPGQHVMLEATAVETHGSRYPPTPHAMAAFVEWNLNV